MIAEVDDKRGEVVGLQIGMRRLHAVVDDADDDAGAAAGGPQPVDVGARRFELYDPARCHC